MLLLGVLLCSEIFSSFVLGLYTEPNSPSTTHMTKTSYAQGTSYGCSFKYFKSHCWRYCDGNSGNWCYTVYDEGRTCHDDHDCYYHSACQGWCAWNSQRGCAKACHEQVTVQKPQFTNCRRGRPYWECQAYGVESGFRSHIAMEGKWISADISNEQFLNKTGNTLVFTGNTVTSTKDSTGIPQSALWYPTGPIQIASTTFYWTFTIREKGSSIFVGITTLNKVEPGWGLRGLFYGGNLSDGSGLLIEKFGPELKTGDELSMLIKFVDKKMKIYIYLNDQPLGIAFDVPENIFDGIYPVVKFSGKGSVKIQERKSTDAPSQLEIVKPLSLEGNWTLYAIGSQEFFDNKTTMKISKIYDRVHDRVYRLRIHLLNRFIGKLTEKSKLNWIGEIIDKTKLKGSVKEMELETQVAEHISGIKNIVLDTVKGELLLESNASTSVWKQIEPKMSFVNWNPFNKTKN